MHYLDALYRLFHRRLAEQHMKGAENNALRVGRGASGSAAMNSSSMY
jgi:hypothetical protein